MNVVVDTDVGGLSKDGVGLYAAIFADRVQVSVATERFGIFFGTEVTELDVKVGELAVTHRKVAEDFSQCRSKHFPGFW